MEEDSGWQWLNLIWIIPLAAIALPLIAIVAMFLLAIIGFIMYVLAAIVGMA